MNVSIGFLITLIGLLCTATGVVLGLLTLTRNRDKDMRNDASESAVIRTKLDNINQGVESIRIDIKANEKQVAALNERVVRVEESSKQAHRRLDSIEMKGEV